MYKAHKHGVEMKAEKWQIDAGGRLHLKASVTGVDKAAIREVKWLAGVHPDVSERGEISQQEGMPQGKLMPCQEERRKTIIHNRSHYPWSLLHNISGASSAAASAKAITNHQPGDSGSQIG